MSNLSHVQDQFNAAWGLYGDSRHIVIMSLTAQRSSIILNNIGGTKDQWKDVANQYMNLILESKKCGDSWLAERCRSLYKEIKEKCK